MNRKMKVSLLFALFLTLLTISVVFAVADFSLGYNPQNGNANYMLMYTYKNDGPTTITGVNGSFDLEVAWVEEGPDDPRQGGFNNGLRYAVTTGGANLNAQGWPLSSGTTWGTELVGDLLVNNADVLATDLDHWLSDGEMDARNLAKRNRTFSLPDIPAGEELTFVWFGDYASLTPPLTDMLAAVDNFVLTGDTDGDLVAETLYAQDFDAIGQAFLDAGQAGTFQPAPSGWRARVNSLDSTNMMVVGAGGGSGTFILGYYAYGGEPPEDDQGPVTSNVTAAPSPAAAADSVTVTALVDDSATGGSNVASADYRVLAPGGAQVADGPMTDDDGFDSPTEQVSTSFTPATLGFPAGQHGVYQVCVRGTDSAGNVGSETCTSFVYDDVGPVTSNVTPLPDRVSNGDLVTVSAQVDDSDTGNSNVASAVYHVFDPFGTEVASGSMSGAFSSPTEQVSASFTASGFGFPTGEHSVYQVCVKGTDSVDNTGDELCTDFNYDDVGPVTSGVTPLPARVPNGVSVAVSAQVDDAVTGGSNVTSAAYRVFDPFGTEVASGSMSGTFSSPTEQVSASFTASGSGFPLDDHGVYQVCVYGTDSVGNAGAELCTDLVYDDDGPDTSGVLATPNPAAIDETVSVVAVVDDSATGNSDVASAGYVVYDEAGVPLTSGPMVATDGSFDSPTEDVNAAFAASDPAAQPGVYHLCVSGLDSLANPGPESCVMFVVHDPSGGFVTGGGWIWSPVNTNLPFMQVQGKANFGFVSKYKKGASVPTGNTQFQLKAGDLKFRSTSYDWLVVTGDGSANYKGHGTVNGQGNYRFRLWAGDGSPDTFRLKIWSEDQFGNETVVYDNGTHQPIGGGSIVVHKGKNK